MTVSLTETAGPVSIRYEAETVSELADLLKATKPQKQDFQLVKSYKEDGWVKWGGGARPVDSSARVDVALRDGTMYEDRNAGPLRWAHHHTESDIVAYRVCS